MTPRPASGGWPGARAILIACALGLAASGEASAAPLAGTPIVSVADADGVDGFSGLPLIARSNAVRAIVQPLEALSLVPDRGAIALPGATLSFAHRLSNPGNATTDARLDLTNLAGDDFDLGALTITHDRNRNGIADAGDTPVAPGGVVTLAPGAFADLLVGANVPLPVPGLARALLRLTATGLAQGATAFATDTASTPSLVPAPTLAFFSANDYAQTTTSARVAQPLYLEADAPGCDADPGVVDRVRILFMAQLTGDQEWLDAVETGPATGIFRVLPHVPTLDGRSAAALPGDGALALVRGDIVTARLDGCGAIRTEARVWVDPGGIVFDGRSDAPIAGATVSLLDVQGAGNGGNPGGPARVWQATGPALAPSIVVTGADGRFAFPRISPSTYRLVVAPPPGYRFPSTVAPGALPPGHPIDPAGSYGRDFATTAPDEPVRADIPLDADASAVLFLEKRAARAFVELGDDVDYTLTVANRGDSALAAVTLTDALPAGFVYVPGSARRDSAQLDDPAGGRGPSLVFALGGFGPRATATLRYRVRVGPGALDGDGINRAVASSGSVVSNTASARVTVLGGTFAEEATVIGSVWLDADRDRERGAGDPGIAGVRLYLDDGTFAITDREGNYSFYGVTPRTHALKLDATTLPPRALPVALDHRQSGRAGTRFVDLTLGELARADFAVATPFAPADSSARDTAMIALVQARRADPRRAAGELARAAASGARMLDPDRPAGDPRARPAAGVVNGESELPLFASAEGASVGEDGAPRGAGPQGEAAPAPARPPAPPLEQTLPALGRKLRFIGLADGDTLAADQTAIMVAGEAGIPFDLRVNDVPVPATRVGRKLSIPDRGIEAWEFVGVRFTPGSNRIEVSQTSPAGWLRGHEILHVVSPDRLARIDLIAPATVPADGHSAAAVRVRLLDARGVPVTSRTAVTLEASRGRFATEDLDPVTPGLQIMVEGGERRVPLLAPGDPGSATLRASAAGASGEGTLEFVPELRPLLAVGTLEGVVSLASLTRGPSAASRPRTGFEAPLETFASQRRDGRAGAAAHGALFVKGRLRDDVLLTLGYDSDKPAGLRSFRDIQPEAYYPIYGDASVRGYEAQSTGQLYARIERRGASLLYGDFVTPAAGGTRSLASYQRSLSGVQSHAEDRRASFDAFSSRERARHRVEEIRGRGISGPYDIGASPFVENSERVEIVTRDRSQPAIVLRASARARFVDYEVEPLTGRLLFKAPVPSVDADLNPVFIRVSVEVEQGGEPFWVSGMQTRVKVGRALEVGGSYVDDHDPGAPYELRSAFAAVALAPKTTLEAEVARSFTAAAGAGLGARLEFKREDPRLESRAWAAATGPEFSNPLAGFGAGRSEAGGRLSARLTPRARLNVEGEFSADALGRERRGGLLAALDQTLSDALRGELGVRVSEVAGPGATAGDPNVAVRARLSAQLPRHPSLSGFGEVEQDVRDEARHMAALGGEYRFSSRGRLYARHELISSLSGPWALAASQRQLATVIGVDADVARDQHAFGEYRMADALSGREAEAALGLRNAWRLDGGYRISTSFERVSPLLGDPAGATTALTGAMEFAESDACKGSTRAELRTGRASDSFLTTIAAACRLDPLWTLLVRNATSVTDERSRGNHALERMQVALACRSASAGGWGGLARYELRYDRDVTAPGDRHRRLAHVVSTHAAGRLDEHLNVSLGWAGRHAFDRSDGLGSASLAQWVHGRATLDLARNWDSGVSASLLAGDGLRSRRYGLGIEVGRQLTDGVWLSGGFNRFGFDDPELTAEAFTRAGGFLRLRCKFDEDLLLGRGDLK